MGTRNESAEMAGSGRESNRTTHNNRKNIRPRIHNLSEQTSQLSTLNSQLSTVIKPSAPHDVDRAMSTAGDPMGYTPLESSLDKAFPRAANNNHIHLFMFGKLDQLFARLTILDDHFDGDIIFQRAFLDNIKNPAA